MSRGRAAVDGSYVILGAEVSLLGARNGVVGLDHETTEVALVRVGRYLDAHILAGLVAERGLCHEKLRGRGGPSPVESMVGAQIDAGQCGRTCNGSERTQIS